MTQKNDADFIAYKEEMKARIDAAEKPSELFTTISTMTGLVAATMANAMAQAAARPPEPLFDMLVNSHNAVLAQIRGNELVQPEGAAQ